MRLINIVMFVVLICCITTARGVLLDGPYVCDICVDPGHGGNDYGASHYDSISGFTLLEKDCNLYVAYTNFWGNLIEGFEYLELLVTATRVTDAQPEHERNEIGRGVAPDAYHGWYAKCLEFISVHHNAGEEEDDTSSHGTEILYCNSIDPDGLSEKLAELLLGGITGELDGMTAPNDYITHPYEADARGVIVGDYLPISLLDDDQVAVITETAFVPNTDYVAQEFYWLYYGLTQTSVNEFLTHEAYSIGLTVYWFIVMEDRFANPVVLLGENVGD